MSLRLVGRIALLLVAAAVVVVGCVPTLRFMGYLPALGKREPTDWQLTSVAPDRRSVVIRPDVCGGRYSGAQITRVGRDVRLTVYMRRDRSLKPACIAVEAMPMRVVQLGFALSRRGRVLGAQPASAP